MKRFSIIFQNKLKKTERMIIFRISDLINENSAFPIFTHNIDFVNKVHYKREIPYEKTEPNQLVTDYIASMTDDYFVDLYSYLFPNDKLQIEYKSYFD